jgi:hypothetical protein
LEEESPRAYIPDVEITESWDNPTGPVGPASPAQSAGGAVVEAAKPVLVDLGEIKLGEIKLRHLEIADSRGHVITVLEFLSPANKMPVEHRVAWKQKRKNNLAAGHSCVEIDLIRAGAWTLPDYDETLRIPENRVCHAVCVTRPSRPSLHEFYPCPLRERLPVIRIPLRRGEPDTVLDLQALIDQAYEHGRYARKIAYAKPPEPPLPPEDLAWARELLAHPPKN